MLSYRDFYKLCFLFQMTEQSRYQIIKIGKALSLVEIPNLWKGFPIIHIDFLSSLSTYVNEM